jgi:hypothetical protein
MTLIVRLRDTRLLVLAAAACLLFALLGAAGADASPTTTQLTCTRAEKAQYQSAAAAYAKRMLRVRAAYFKTHMSAKLRAKFVKKQNAKLKALRIRASCELIDLNPSPSANETFTFGPGMPAGAEDLIKGDIAFAAEDESRLVGLSLDKVVVFASSDANWLAGQQCGFYGYGGNCVSDTAAFYASGNSAGQGGPGAVFLYWASSAWQYGDAANQKIIAHELFHVLQYQTHHLIHAGETPFNQVRPTGPVWLDEGAPEMIGFRVMADRRLDTYADALDTQIAFTRQNSTPLDQLERLSQTFNVPNVYSLFALSVDHLLKVSPAGVSSLAAYYRALGAGAAWADAFKQAFGMSVADYYANFAAYRSKL